MERQPGTAPAHDARIERERAEQQQRRQIVLLPDEAAIVDRRATAGEDQRRAEGDPAIEIAQAEEIAEGDAEDIPEREANQGEHWVFGKEEERHQDVDAE